MVDFSRDKLRIKAKERSKISKADSLEPRENFEGDLHPRKKISESESTEVITKRVLKMTKNEIFEKSEVALSEILSIELVDKETILVVDSRK